MPLLIRPVDSLDACIYAEIRTRIPETISWDYNFEPAATTPLTFTVEVLYFSLQLPDYSRAEPASTGISTSLKFLQATTSNLPSTSSVVKDNRGSKLTIGRGGILKVQDLVSIARLPASHPHIESVGY
ncbi:hypothetical protein SLEP1_g9102 [Rubroshorea leprosula]|uniref:Antifreeze protein n=1 Tax=Rubroshorea leprosula TaxID=152421 RepID=A0AAV5I3U9_9ROSI|nr:hypothetical protein SLEP1_g9102 [Rubroshorea leprosula]